MYEVQKQSDTFWLAALHKPTKTPLRRRGGSDPLVSRTNNSCSSPSESGLCGGPSTLLSVLAFFSLVFLATL